MKKVILLGLVLNSWFSHADIEVTKKHRGIFGYKSVIEIQGEGSHKLICTDPGKTRCQPQLELVVDGTLTLTYDEYTTIEESVDKYVIGKEKESGKFIFDNKCCIVYNYNPHKHVLMYTIYSMTEAKQKNLI